MSLFLNHLTSSLFHIYCVMNFSNIVYILRCIFKLWQESIVDSRFKLLAADFQDQIDDLKGQVVTLRGSKTIDLGVMTSSQHGHDIQKRQANPSKPRRPICENSSSFCTFFHPDHPDADRKKIHYSPTLPDEIMSDPIKMQGMPTSCNDLQLLSARTQTEWTVFGQNISTKPGNKNWNYILQFSIRRWIYDTS